MEQVVEGSSQYLARGTHILRDNVLVAPLEDFYKSKDVPQKQIDTESSLKVEMMIQDSLTMSLKKRESSI